MSKKANGETSAVVPQTNRTTNTVKNLFFGFGNRLVILILSFINRSFFINILGAEYLGLNGLFVNVLSMLSLADLGLGTAMVYSFYHPLAQKDKNKLAALTQYYKKLYNYIAFSVACIGISLVPFLNTIINTQKEIPYLWLYYLLFLINSVISYLFVSKISILTADQKNYIVSRYSTIFQIIISICQLIVLIICHNYAIYITVMIVCTVINNLLLARKTIKLYPYIERKVKISKNERSEIFLNIRSVFLYKVSGILLNGTDNIIISSIIGTIYVGYYSNYNMILNAISQFVSTVFTSTNASIGNLIVNEGEEKRYQIFKTMTMIAFWIGGFCSVSLFILISDFIELWIGSKYVFNELTLIAIVLNFYLSCIMQPIWSYREATGLFKQTRYIMFFTAILNLFLSLLLGYKFGIGGVIFASFLARILTYYWYEPIILFKSYFKKSAKYMFTQYLIQFVIMIGIALITYAATSVLQEVTYINFILKLIICATIPNIVYFLVNYRTTSFQFLVKKITKRRLN
ncbi:sugar translocase [Sporolactobacillus sp. CPB3-1]|uniref:Sugar translocase n=1 Tax=Sporolactobacillus mangiferae TaxID=2940498 RepID=A0ABT0M8G9_9BACL|nr:sugar translocase [Sporolactobacillus mangiferae]MCL1631166.1 sugar translocase [Sporolactobacillus mangiferae]